MATTSLLIGSALTFHHGLSDYFYIIGTSLFCLNSILKLLCEIRNKMKAKPKIHLYTNI